jgi:hypothetical protein
MRRWLAQPPLASVLCCLSTRPTISPTRSLEPVRLLSKVETHKRRPIQIVRAGDVHVAGKLPSHALASGSLPVDRSPWRPRRVEHYVDHRLRIVWYTGGPLFTPEACELVAARNEGISARVQRSLRQGTILELMARVFPLRALGGRNTACTTRAFYGWRPANDNRSFRRDRDAGPAEGAIRNRRSIFKLRVNSCWLGYEKPSRLVRTRSHDLVKPLSPFSWCPQDAGGF